MRQRINYAEAASLIWAVFLAGFGIYTSIIAGSVTEREAKIYMAFASFTCFWCATLMLMVAYRLHTINPEREEFDNANCFRSWKVLFRSIIFSQDFQLQRYIGICLVVILFHSTLSLITRNSRNPDSFNSFEEYMQESIIIFVISFITGIAAQLYLVVHLIQMFADYREYQKALIYCIHIKASLEEEIQFKKQITQTSIGFCILAAIYYIVKVILYGQIYNTVDGDKNYQVFTSLVIIQSLACIILSAKVGQQLITIFRNISNITDTSIFNRNLACFTGWFVLVKSLIYSRKHRLWRNIILILLIVQTIYGLISFPFFKLYSVTIYELYTAITYLYCDTAVITCFLFWRFADSLARLFHQVKVRMIVYDVEQSDPVIIPIEPIGPIFGQQIQYAGQEQSRIMQLPNVTGQDEEQAQKDLGECCICLDIMNQGQRVYRLRCHQSHIFHYYCISKWMVSHNNCPLCQKPIY